MKRIAVLFLAATLAVSGGSVSAIAQEENHSVNEEYVENSLSDLIGVENEQKPENEQNPEGDAEELPGEGSDIIGDEDHLESSEESASGETEESQDGQVDSEGDAQEESKAELQEDVPDEEEVPEEEAVPEPESLLVEPVLTYQSHVQTDGWQGWKHGGELSGTEGRSLRMEALRIKLENPEDTISGSIEYRAHVQNYGWMKWKKDGELAGTEGQSKRMEAIEIRLTGKLAEQYDIYYRVHIQNYGWLDWVKNGASAGSSGLSSRMESCMIRLVKKGDPSPSTGARGFIKSYDNQDLTFRGHIQTIGNTRSYTNGQTLGTVGKSLRLEAMYIQLDTSDPFMLNGGIEYAAHVQNIGWQGFQAGGKMAGTQGQSKRMEAIKIRLTGELAKCYDIYYRTHVQNFGWLGWAKNGQAAGSEGYACRMEAVLIMLRPKTLGAPGSTANVFKKKPVAPARKTLSAALGFDGTKIVKELSAHQNDSYYVGTPYRPLKNPANLNELLYPNGDRRADGFSGMNCTGFVTYVTQKCGASLSAISQMGLRGGVCNASNWLRYFRNMNVEYYQYNSVSALLNSGKAEKGDIIYCEPTNWNNPGADCHIGFFWGNTSRENKFWHSSTSPGKGNQISGIVPASYPSYYLLVKMR